jgi:hypothetical protein
MRRRERGKPLSFLSPKASAFVKDSAKPSFVYEGIKAQTVEIQDDIKWEVLLC